MEIWEIALLGVALAMDACAVAMTDGMTKPKMPFWQALLIGLAFGFFQFLMPLVGYYITRLVADNFVDVFESVSAWVSFGLLAFLGGKMLIESIVEIVKAKKAEGIPVEKPETVGDGSALKQEIAVKTCSVAEGCESDNCPVVAEEKFSIGKLLLQAIATAIDALAVGVTLCSAEARSGLALGAWGATGMIGVITLALALSAVYIGKAIGNKLADKAGVFGGVVLLGIGIKILIESFL